MKHPTPIQLDMYNAGAYDIIRSLAIRFHLKHCALCRERLKEIQEEENSQKFIAAEAARYMEAEEKTEDTLREYISSAGRSTQTT